MWQSQFERFRTGVYQGRFGGSPNWVTRAALTAAVIVIVVPLLVLALAGIVVGTVVFIVLGLIARLVAMVRFMTNKMTGGGDGRRNVRIIRSLLAALLVTAAAAAHAADEPATVADAEKPTWNTLASPRETMFTFLENTTYLRQGHEQARPRVRKTLSLPEGSNADVLDLAEKLLDVIDRLGEVKVDDLPDKDEVSRTGMRRFIFFPRGTHHDWVWKSLGHAPDGRIILTADSENQWRFSADTVAGIPALFDSMKNLPPIYVPAEEQDDRGSLFSLVGPTFKKTTWGEWIALLAAIFAGMAMGKVVQSFCRSAANRLEDRQGIVRATVFRNIASPASLLLLTVALLVGLRFIYMAADVREFSNHIIKFLGILAVGWFLYNLVDVIDLFLRRITEKTASKLDDMVVPLVRKSLRVFLVIVFSLVVAQNVFGLDITGWLAGLGIAGLAVSLAAQDSIKNLFGSITVFFDKPFTVGDRIKFTGFDGPVEEIGFRSTRMRNLDGHLITIPNMKFIDTPVENVGARSSIKRVVNVTITYDTPVEKIDEAIQIIKDILAQPNYVQAFKMDTQPPRVYFNELNADSLNIIVIYWYQLDAGAGRDYFAYMTLSESFNRELFRRFGEAKIEFAFPTRTLFLAGDPNRQLSLRIERNSPESA